MTRASAMCGKAHRRVIGQWLAGGEAVGIVSNRLVPRIPIDMHKESVHIQ
jgi:hypothetical protein